MSFNGHNKRNSSSTIRDLVRHGDYLPMNSLDINLGRINGSFSRDTLFGQNEAIDTTERILSPNSPVATNDITFISTARILSVASTSANDTSAGTGAKQVTLFGLDANLIEFREVVILNGQTEVDTVNLFTQINQCLITDSGTSLINEGDIYISDDTDTFTLGVPQNRVYNAIKVGDGISKTATFTVPKNKILAIETLVVSSDAVAGKEFILKIQALNAPLGVKQIVVDKYIVGSGIIEVDLSNIRAQAEGSSLFVTVQRLTGSAINAHIRLSTILKDIS